MIKLLLLLHLVFGFLFRQNDPSSSSFEIEVNGIRNGEGTLNILIFTSEEGFPDNPEDAFREKTIRAKKGVASFHFDHLPPGNYAFAIHHDENENLRMDKNLIGIPREGFAFSNDYNPRTPNPSFRKAEIEIRSGEQKLVVDMVYYL